MFIFKCDTMWVIVVPFFLRVWNLCASNECHSEIGPRQLINSKQRCINQQRVFFNFFFSQRVVKGEQERNVFRELFSISSENRGKH